MAVGDFNGDGKPDLAVTDFIGSVIVLLGDWAGGFATAAGSPYTTEFGSYSVGIGEFNGDGRPDLAIANMYGNDVTVLLNTAANFAPIVPSDFNHDGRPDVIWEDPASGFAQAWYLGGTQGVTVIGAVNLTQSNPWHIVSAADFDGNGTPDLVWQGPVSGAVQVWFMGGSGGNVVMSAADITGQNPWQVVSVADFNRDGHPDLLWKDPASGSSQIWYLGGPQGITFLGAATVDQTNPWQIVGTGDFNGDGVPDVLWQDPVSGLVQIWYMGGATPGREAASCKTRRT